MCDPQPLLHHGEIVRRDGVAVGYVRAGSYGHTLGGAVGLAMVQADGPGAAVTKDWLSGAEWSVEIAGRQYPACGLAAAAIRPRQLEDQGLTAACRR